jgi:hypothetical protein
MKNYFENMSDEELTKCYEQRLEAQKTGVFAENPMRTIIDEYAKISVNCLLMAETGLLDEIAKRWYKLI